MMTDHDPFTEPETAHPRARKLMTEPLFWDCGDESAPFGSDEGCTAYYEWRRWRAENPMSPLTDCLNWICGGQLQSYTMELASEEHVRIAIESPETGFLYESYDVFTLDTTIIATGLGQLMDEGKIDEEAKRYLKVAIERQRDGRLTDYATERSGRG